MIQLVFPDKCVADDYLSKAELLSIQKGMEDIKNGRTYKMKEGESLTDFLKRTEASATHP